MSMAQLTAMQMIFTRVEANYSPHRKSGYQTVYHSSGLSASDVQEIEKHVQCFQTNEPSLVRRQFFTLQSGYVVVTHTITIETIAEIVDKYQRSGVFLAHCLIFSKNLFEKADNNPFQIFDAFHNFMRNAPDMIAQFNQIERREPRCAINITSSPIRANSSNHNTKLTELIEKRAEQKTKSLLFYGTEKEIDKTLRAAFDLTPKEKRLTRTFNSHIDRCMIRPGTYWAVGASSRQSGPYIPIHASLRKGEATAPRVVNTKKSQRYVTAASQPDNLTALALNIENLLIEAQQSSKKNGNDSGLIQPLAREVQNNSILFWGIIFRKPLEAERVKKMVGFQFRKKLNLIFDPIQPTRFFVDEDYLAHFFEKVAQKQLKIQDKQFIELVKAMIAVRKIKSLNKLINRVFYLEDEALTSLEQELERLYNAPKPFEFAEAVKKRREWLEKPSRLRSALSTLTNKFWKS